MFPFSQKISIEMKCANVGFPVCRHRTKEMTHNTKLSWNVQGHMKRVGWTSSKVFPMHPCDYLIHSHKHIILVRQTCFLCVQDVSKSHIPIFCKVHALQKCFHFMCQKFMWQSSNSGFGKKSLWMITFTSTKPGFCWVFWNLSSEQNTEGLVTHQNNYFEHWNNLAKSLEWWWNNIKFVCPFCVLKLVVGDFTARKIQLLLDAAQKFNFLHNVSAQKNILTKTKGFERISSKVNKKGLCNALSCCEQNLWLDVHVLELDLSSMSLENSIRNWNSLFCNMFHPAPCSLPHCCPTLHFVLCC